MDDIVKQAIAKWPNVPAVFGWLALDRRGNWLIKGERISNPAVIAFISRNYGHDTRGRWFFQNGPQRVFAALDYTPLVYRITWEPAASAAPCIEAHTGEVAQRVESAWIDDAGVLLLMTEHGMGMIDDRDLDRLLPCFTDERGNLLPEDAAASAIECLQAGGNTAMRFRFHDRAVPVSAVAARDVPASFGFVQRPMPPDGQEKCE